MAADELSPPPPAGATPGIHLHREAARRARQGPREWAIGLTQYVTNHVVGSIPVIRLRHLWYRSVLGAEIGPGAAIHLHAFFWFDGPGRSRRERLLRIGRGSWVSRSCVLDTRYSITIGEDVSISPEVAILTAKHLHDDPGFPVVGAPVVIEDHSWIAMRAVIMPGVRIGRGAVVAAGSIVTKDVPPLAVVAGVPARRVGTRAIDPTYKLGNPMIPFA